MKKPLYSFVTLFFLFLPPATLAQGEDAHNKKVRQSFSGTFELRALDTDNGILHIGGSCEGKGSLGPFSCTLVGAYSLVPADRDNCPPELPVEFIALQFTLVQRLQTGDLLVSRLDPTAESYVCGTLADPDWISHTETTFDGGTGRFSEATGSAIWGGSGRDLESIEIEPGVNLSTFALFSGDAAGTLELQKGPFRK